MLKGVKSENDDPFTIREKYYYFENVWLYINNLPTTEKKYYITNLIITLT